MLVGRDTERQLIDGLVAGARVGSSGVLVITGEAGIGKTALLGHARQAAGDMRLLTAVGSEAEQDVPFGGLAQLLRPSPEDLDGIPAPQAQALGVALALREGLVADRLAVGAGVLSLLTRYSEHRPLGVLVDDAHLIDRPSIGALTFACRRFLADSVFVVIAARTDEAGAITGSGLAELPLTGLDPDSTRQLARSRVGHSAPEWLDVVHRVTGGNPLAVLELARDPAVASALAAGTSLPMPATLTRWFGRRAAALGEATRTLLLLAAVAGGDLAVVARAAATLGVDLEDLTAAERAGLVTVGRHRIEFAHPLVRAAVLANAFPDQRRRLHAVVAEAVPAQAFDRRAWHRSQATVGFDDAVADDLEVAARRAGLRGAHAVSATAFERAAGLSTDDRDRARRLLAAGEAAWRGGDGEAATSLADAVLRLAASPAIRARGLGLQGDVAVRRRSPAVAQELFLAAAAQVVRSEPSQAVLLLAEVISAGFLRGDATTALDAAERAEVLLGPHLEPVAAAVGTLACGMARVLAGGSGGDQIRTGVAMLDAATAAERAAVQPVWLMLGPMWLRESVAGRSLMRSALDQVRARSEVGTLPLLLFLVARDGATTQQWSSAEADYGEAISLARELGHTTELAISLAGLSWLEARMGKADGCQAHAAEALALSERTPVDIVRVWAELALGELALALGDADDAVARLSRVTDLLVEIDLRDPDLSPAPELAEALLRTGDRAAARAVSAAFQEAAAVKGLPWVQARAARLRGLLTGPGELDEHFAAALALHGGTLDAFEEARTRLAYGGRLRRARRRVDAREPLRAALVAFERLGARPWADQAAAELEATGETAVRGAGAGLDRLTPRELQLALLLAEGRTTRQTAAAVFLSPKTVEYHLRSVYTKLGVTSRAELAARLTHAGEQQGTAPDGDRSVRH